LTCLASPLCVFEPKSAEDVAGALRVLENTNTKFAVRSGGHMPVPGAADIADGVLITLNKLDTTELVGSTARIGAGLKWWEVYDWLYTEGLATAGGRFGPVGVGGLLVGTGINYFGSQTGWSVNSVLNYEVVVAGGNIINANATSHPDLWLALKGGSGNFGIVTKYDMATFPLSNVWGGTLEYNMTELDAYVHAIAGYVDPQGGSADKLAAADCLVLMTPQTGEFELVNVLFYQDPIESPAAFSNFTKIPAGVSTTSIRTWTDFVVEQNSSMYSDSQQRYD
jgi:FAD/FMN-containing dehydrogenase